MVRPSGPLGIGPWQNNRNVGEGNRGMWVVGVSPLVHSGRQSHHLSARPGVVRASRRDHIYQKRTPGGTGGARLDQRQGGGGGGPGGRRVAAVFAG